MRELLTAAFLIATSSAVPTAMAEEPQVVAEELVQSRTVNQAKREATISANVEFTNEERSRFWPLYWEYREAVDKIDDRYIRMIQEYADSYQSMSDGQAKKLIQAWLQIALDRYDLKKQYVAKFQTALSAVKTMRVMQIENRLDVMMEESVGRRIPLVVPQN